MAKSLPPCDHLVEEDYIDMDISSATFLYYTISSPPPHSGEFEFQMSNNTRDGESTTSPADELFCKGKLLPLHLPMSSTTPPHGKPPDAFEEKMAATPSTTTTTDTATGTPSESCNISPATSCCLSGVLNSENNNSFECSTRLVRSDPNKSWSKRLKLIRQSSLGLKLKASRAYLNSFFTKSGCSDESSCAVPQAKECSNGHAKAGKKKPFDQIHRERYLQVAGNSTAALLRSTDGEKQHEAVWSHRKSFSGIIKWNSTTKSSSASSSCSSSFSNASSNGPLVLKRGSSVNSEVESSIQGAIAYCKKSQQLVCARKSASDVGYYSLSAPRIAAACENQEKPRLCRDDEDKISTLCM